MKIGIIGNGFVGKATNILNNNKTDIIIYDKNPKLCEPNGITIDDIIETDLIMICVPTPMNKDGSCHLDILKSVVYEIENKVSLDEKIVIIRSTIPVGTCKELNCYFMPEFLTEKNYMKDFKERECWIFGLKEDKHEQNGIFKNYMYDLIRCNYYSGNIINRDIKYVSSCEAEMIKLFRNNYLAVKIGFCNEIAEFCDKKNLNYEKIIDIACSDKRIGKSHTLVPGHDDRRGFGGTCFPKDIHNLKVEMDKINMTSYIIKATIDRNEKVDRVEKDWEKNKGRSIV
tara:strand:+ start:49 stop:903 length:855 start_codon:yes stop_codon:yes gene_type:complete